MIYFTGSADTMTMAAAEGGEGVQGSEEIDETTDPPTIKKDFSFLF